MLSTSHDAQVLTIYPVYIKYSVLNKYFIAKKFRDIDKSDIPGISLQAFNITLGLIAGCKLYNPIFSNSFGVNTNQLNNVIYSAQALMQRGKVFLSNHFPSIHHRYVTYSIYDFVNTDKNELAPKDNPFDKNALNHVPYLKDVTWVQAYIVSFCTEEELMKVGLNHGFLTLTRNDAVQLCELICDNKFPPPRNYRENVQFVDRLIDDAGNSDDELSCIKENRIT
jgi:hypothetical protein